VAFVSRPLTRCVRHQRHGRPSSAKPRPAPPWRAASAPWRPGDGETRDGRDQRRRPLRYFRVQATNLVAADTTAWRRVRPRHPGRHHRAVSVASTGRAGRRRGPGRDLPRRGDQRRRRFVPSTPTPPTSYARLPPASSRTSTGSTSSRGRRSWLRHASGVRATRQPFPRSSPTAATRLRVRRHEPGPQRHQRLYRRILHDLSGRPSTAVSHPRRFGPWQRPSTLPALAADCKTAPSRPWPDNSPRRRPTPTHWDNIPSPLTRPATARYPLGRCGDPTYTGGRCTSRSGPTTRATAQGHLTGVQTAARALRHRPGSETESPSTTPRSARGGREAPPSEGRPVHRAGCQLWQGEQISPTRSRVRASCAERSLLAPLRPSAQRLPTCVHGRPGGGSRGCRRDPRGLARTSPFEGGRHHRRVDQITR